MRPRSDHIGGHCPLKSRVRTPSRRAGRVAALPPCAGSTPAERAGASQKLARRRAHREDSSFPDVRPHVASQAISRPPSSHDGNLGSQPRLPRSSVRLRHGATAPLAQLGRARNSRISKVRNVAVNHASQVRGRHCPNSLNGHSCGRFASDPGPGTTRRSLSRLPASASRARRGVPQGKPAPSTPRTAERPSRRRAATRSCSWTRRVRLRLDAGQ